jgi:hypothetical protein
MLGPLFFMRLWGFTEFPFMKSLVNPSQTSSYLEDHGTVQCYKWVSHIRMLSLHSTAIESQTCARPGMRWQNFHFQTFPDLVRKVDKSIVLKPHGYTLWGMLKDSWESVNYFRQGNPIKLPKDSDFFCCCWYWGFELRALCLLSWHSTTQATPLALFCFSYFFR